MQTVEEGEQWMLAIRWVSLNYAHSRCFDLFFLIRFVVVTLVQ